MMLNRPMAAFVPVMGMAMLIAASLLGAATASAQTDARLAQVLASDHRSPAFAARDVYRNPAETLKFFGLQPGMTVVEVSPGAGGWYTEILAPYLRDTGKLYAAQFNPQSTVDYFRTSHAAFMEKLSAAPQIYNQVTVTAFELPNLTAIAPVVSADLVLTFRNVHSWYDRNGGDDGVLAAFRAFNQVLKPGGTLGIVEHRLPAGRPKADQAKSGYMLQAEVIRLAEQAGFTLTGISNINANPRDTADHPAGVWTLPPSLRLGETHQARYRAIGESDRMTLRFEKTR